MAVRVAINGFGRIGRLAFRQMYTAEGFEIVAINDLTSPKMLAHLLKYDSTQGKFELYDKVSYTDNSIIVDGKEITIYVRRTLLTFRGRSLISTSFLSAQASTPPRLRLRLTSMQAQSMSSSPLRQATTFRPSFTMSTMRS